MGPPGRRADHPGMTGALTVSFTDSKSWNNARFYFSQFILRAKGVRKDLVFFFFFSPLASKYPSLVPGIVLMALGMESGLSSKVTIVPVRWVLLHIFILALFLSGLIHLELWVCKPALPYTIALKGDFNPKCKESNSTQKASGKTIISLLPWATVSHRAPSPTILYLVF